MRSKLLGGLSVMFLIGALSGCRTDAKIGDRGTARTGTKLERTGDEIMVAGELFHTGAPVVLWTDPGGFDAYRTERRFAEYDKSSFEATVEAAKQIEKETGKPANFAEVKQPQRLDLRSRTLSPEEINQVRGGGWPLSLLQQKVDQFVYHFDVTGTSSQCFFILHDIRGLSVHFMLDVDGTIYQTCDVKERAWHATKSNHRSVGIEIANIGAYPLDDKEHTLSTWYRKESDGRTRIVLPPFVMKAALRTKDFIGRPARNETVVGNIQGKELEMYDLTPQQYDSIIKLTAALCTALPKITCDYPRDENGKLITKALSDEEWTKYQGVMGHFHVQTNKTDPGPAFDFDKVRDDAWKLMSKQARKANDAARNNPVQLREPPSTQPTTTK